MNHVPVTLNPYPDETAYSWISRLAKANGLSLHAFSDAYLGTRGSKEGLMQFDVRAEYPALFSRITKETGIKDTFLSLSTLPFESICMSKYAIERYINNVFQPKSRLNAPVATLFTDARVCPACMEEDKAAYGEPYLHRAHQLTGVCVCHKHKVPLLSYNKAWHERYGKVVVNRSHACDYEDYSELRTEPSLKSAAVYASYVEQLLWSGVVTNSHKVTKILRDGLLGYCDGSFWDAFKEWEHFGLFYSPDAEFFLKKKIVNGISLAMSEVLPVLMFLYPDPASVIKRIKEMGSDFMEYTCPECGETYCTSTGNAWVCPRCHGHDDEQDLFSNIVQEVGNGEYLPLSEFTSMQEKTLFLHTVCGRESWINAKGFLFSGSRCACQTVNAPLDMETEVNSIPGFTYLGLASSRKDKMLKIRHDACGHVFIGNYYRFKRRPKCPVCEPRYPTAKTFPDRVKALVGDEYEVLGTYTYAVTPLPIKHKLCGKIHNYRPHNFLHGQRCPYCTEKNFRVDLEVELDSYAGGRYKLAIYGTNDCVVRDTATDKDIPIKKSHLLQEIRRPTPSAILPEE